MVGRLKVSAIFCRFDSPLMPKIVAREGSLMMVDFVTVEKEATEKGWALRKKINRQIYSCQLTVPTLKTDHSR